MAASLDPNTLARELLRAWRGRRSQRAASLRLGYTTNVVNGWESGRRAPTARAALAMARSAGVDLDAAVATLVDDRGLDLATDAGVAAFLRVIRGRARTGALAASTGCSRFTVSRWLSGRGRPALGELLAYVDAATGRLAAFATALAGRRGVPSLRAHREVLEARMALAQRDPWAQVVLAALCLHTYAETPAHDDAWVGAVLGMAPDAVRRAIGLLADAGQVRWDGVRWDAVPIFSQDAGGDPDAVLRFKAHWTREATARLPGAPGDLFSTNVFTASAADQAAIRELHVAHFRAIHAVVTASTGPLDRVLVVNTQLVDLAGTPAALGQTASDSRGTPTASR